MRRGAAMIPGMVMRELVHRPLPALLGALLLALAVAAPLLADANLRAHRQRSEAWAQRRGEEAAERMARVERDLRKITLGMGYNVMAVAPEQDLDQLRLDGVPSVDMAQADGEALAATRPDTINHLLPVLMRRVRWPERGLDIILSGAGGETWIAAPRTQAPLLQRIAPGTCVPSRILAERLGLAVGDRVELLGRTLTVGGIRGARGGIEDAMLWLDLAQAQEMLAAPGRISAVYGLLCQCGDAAGAAALAQMRQVLPRHQLVVFAVIATARGEMMDLGARAKAEVIAAERSAAERELAALSALQWRIVAGLALVALLVIMTTTWTNVRDRQTELAVLRAVGWSGGRVGLLVLGRQLVVGCVGMGLGAGAALLADPGIRSVPLLLAAIAGTPLLAMLAAVPASVPVWRREPASLLKEL